VSTNEITTTAAWVAGVAVLVLIVAGWRKPARASIDPQRARPGTLMRAGVPQPRPRVDLYRPAPWWKRLWALVTGSFLALLIGAITATLLAYAAAWAVITLTDLLEQ
jgi:glycerol uptake facilitator-like aquaporin